MTKISPATMSKIVKEENITTEVISKICKALQCDVKDIMEYKEKGEEAEQYTSVEYLQYVFRGVIYMTRKDRVVKLLNQEEMTLNRLLLFFQDNNLILDNKDLYEDLEKATENNKIIQEELAY